MRRLRSLAIRTWNALARKDADDLAAQIDADLQLRIDDNLRAGVAPEAARREAVLRLGGIERTKEQCRDQLGVPAIDAIVRDVRYAIRVLRRSPAFATVAVGTLALGIGANAVVFTIIDHVLVR